MGEKLKRRRHLAGAGLWSSRARGAVALEFAILSIPFFMMALGVLEISYDLYTQAALDSALFSAVRQLQTGNAQHLQNGGSFVSSYLCPGLHGLLACDQHVFVNVRKFVAAGLPGSGGTTDYWNITTGVLPMAGDTLNLSAYQGSTSFCNVAPAQFILVSAIYLGPTFLGQLLPNVLSVQYGGQSVHATLSTFGVATERFSPSGAAAGSTLAPSC